LGRASTKGVIRHYVGPGAWSPRTIFKTTFKIKMVHSEEYLNLFPGK